jgi:hypothetical protein
MDPVLLGTSAVSAIGSTLGSTVLWASFFKELLARTLETTRALFNPVFFGSGFLLAFIFAWFRMERIAEAKRIEANSRILLKRSSDTRVPLALYCDQTNGQLFSINNFLDVFRSMTSKGRKPLKMAPICQPVIKPLEPHILWESAIVRVRTIPVEIPERIDLFEHIRAGSTLSIKDAVQITAQGGLGYMSTRRNIFSKEQTVYISFDFHDAANFMGLFADAHRLKRLCSIPLGDVLHFKTVDIHQMTIKFERLDNLRFHDSTFFNSVCLVICHSTRKRDQLHGLHDMKH